MKEILEELTRAIKHPVSDQLHYVYSEREYDTLYGIERHLFILEKSRYSDQVIRSIFRKSNIEYKDNARPASVDYLEVLRKELLLEVFKYGVFSAIEHLNKYTKTNDKTTDNK